MRADSLVRLDLNNPEFLKVFLDLPAAELQQVARSLLRLRGMDWRTVMTSKGLHWEAIAHIATPNGSTAYSIRLSGKTRAIAYRDADFLRMVSLHPDHDSAYRR
jgi:hypothetical protein